ncbi:MAG: family 10 glycosylhydrolase [Candidatus Sumerlaeia bacterium]|nr:family 10 glycosylhydrolase [Candidatus Sumerlaeia bacterium]
MCLGLAGCALLEAPAGGGETLPPRTNPGGRAPDPSAPAPEPEWTGLREVRGVWLTNVDSTVLDSRARIAEAMQFLADHHFNIVYVVVWNKALTLYPSEVMAKRFGIPIDPRHAGRDPLQEVIEEAHARGIEVVAWFEYGFSCWHESLGPGGGHIVAKYPHWAARDRDGKLATKNGFEWLDALHPEVQDFMLSLVLEVARKYKVDGVQGDDRLPAMPSLAGYDERTQDLYLRETGTLPPADYKNLEWVQWRADKLTEFLARLHREVKAVNPRLTVSMSPSYYDWSLTEYLQDSKTWTDRGLVDTIHPQAYRRTFEAYKSIVDDLVNNQFTAAQLPLLSPGVLAKSGPYVVDADTLLKCIAYNRKNGIAGEVLFFYEALRADGDVLARALKEGPYREPARLPYR